MVSFPGRLLVTGYALAGVAGLGFSYVFGGVIVPILVFWLSGAVITLGIAVFPPTRRYFSRTEAPVADDHTFGATDIDLATPALHRGRPRAKQRGAAVKPVSAQFAASTK